MACVLHGGWYDQFRDSVALTHVLSLNLHALEHAQAAFFCAHCYWHLLQLIWCLGIASTVRAAACMQYIRFKKPLLVLLV